MASRKLTFESDNIIVDYEYEWKIKKFSTYRDGLRGVDFVPLQSVPLTLFVQFDPPVKGKDGYYQYYFHLHQASIEEIPQTVRMEYEIKIHNSSDCITAKSTIGYSFTLKPCQLFVVWEKDGFLYVNNKKISINNSNFTIFQFNFKFFGHNVTTKVSNDNIAVKDTNDRYTSICSAFKSIYDSKAMSDLNFVIGKHVLKAHRCVLAARSSVFKKMLESEFKEGKSKSITITDFNFQVFDCFLRYLYCGDIKDTGFETVWDLYAMADKYDVDSLQKDSSELLASALSAENVCRVFLHAYVHSDSTLIDKAVEFIEQNFSKIKRSTEWKNIIKTYPELASEVLSYISSKLE